MSRSIHIVRVLQVVLMLSVFVGCAVRQPLTRPTMAEDLDRLAGDLDLLAPVAVPATASGSLWSADGMGAALARDTRAYRLNDLLTIFLDERSVGTNQSDTDLNRASDSDFGASVAFGLEDASPAAGKFSLNNVLSSSSSSSFAGDGSTTRANTLSATITTRVMRVMPNGDLVIAGQKTVMVNREKQILTLVGSVRPVDVLSNNRVSSNVIGDLTVRLWGQGEVDTTIRQGWFQRMMNRFWPL